MEFRILGPLEVIVDGQPVAVAGARQPALLGLLLLRAGEVVGADELIEELWGDELGDRAANALQAAISRLRRNLPAEAAARLQTRAGGYVIAPNTGELDAERFDVLVHEGRAARASGDDETAAARFAAALALWRGPALSDIDAGPAIALGVARLEEERLAVTEERIDLDLERGRGAALVGELEALVGRHPLRERFRAQLMLALYRAGRQADALETYRAGRRALVDELGIEPGPALQGLQAQILAQDPALDPPERAAPADGHHHAGETAPPPGRRGHARRRRALALIVAAGAVLVAVLAAQRDDGSNARVRAVPVKPNSLIAIDARTNRVTRSISIGQAPDSLIVDRGVAWVVNDDDSTLSRVDLGSGRVRTLRRFDAIADVAAEPLGTIWVSGFAKRLYDVPVGSLRASPTLSIDRQVEAIAIGAGALWITSPATTRGAGGDLLLKVDAEGRRVVRSYRVGASPLLNTFGYGAVWVANYDGDTVSVVYPGAARAFTVSVGRGPLGITTGEGAVWVACYGDRRLWRIDPVTRRVVGRIPIGRGPLGVAAGAGAVWVANREDPSIMRIDPQTNTVRTRIALPYSPNRVVVDGDTVWATVAVAAERN